MNIRKSAGNTGHLRDHVTPAFKHMSRCHGVFCLHQSCYALYASKMSGSQSCAALFSLCAAFIIGATTSVGSGYLGMAIATYANARTAVEARKGIAPAFAVGECG